MADTSRTLKSLHFLQELVKREAVLDDLVESTVAKLLDYEIGKLEERQHGLQEKLRAFEKQYGLSTPEFTRRFREGGLGDAMDFFEWLALAEVCEDISQALAVVGHAHDGSQHTSYC